MPQGWYSTWGLRVKLWSMVSLGQGQAREAWGPGDCGHKPPERGKTSSGCAQVQTEAEQVLASRGPAASALFLIMKGSILSFFLVMPISAVK